MARKPRIIADNTYHHIIQRGNNRRRVFELDSDYRHFVSIIKRYLKEHSCQIFHYCIMPNHVHMLLHSIKGSDMPKFLQKVNLTYTLYYKKKYRFTGSLWQGRYKSFLIDKDEYLLECARYIERNPVRANMVNDISKYPYSSYNFYANARSDDIISTSLLYSGLGRNPKERQKQYREYFNQDRFYEKIVDKAFEICPSGT